MPRRKPKKTRASKRKHLHPGVRRQRALSRERREKRFWNEKALGLR